MGTVIDMMFITIDVYLQKSVCFIYFKMVLFCHTTNKEKFRKQLVNHSWVVVMGGALMCDSFIRNVDVHQLENWRSSRVKS